MTLGKRFMQGYCPCSGLVVVTNIRLHSHLLVYRAADETGAPTIGYGRRTKTNFGKMKINFFKGYFNFFFLVLIGLA
jgi:hypothetical protein